MQQPVVWIISRDHWLRALLRAEMTERGHDAVGYFAVEDALPERTRRPPDLIVVDLADEDGQLVARLFDLSVPVIALGGAMDFNQPWVAAKSWAAMMRRPFSLGDVADRVAAILASR